MWQALHYAFPGLGKTRLWLLMKKWPTESTAAPTDPLLTQPSTSGPAPSAKSVGNRQPTPNEAHDKDAASNAGKPDCSDETKKKQKMTAQGEKTESTMADKKKDTGKKRRQAKDSDDEHKTEPESTENKDTKTTKGKDDANCN